MFMFRRIGFEGLKILRLLDFSSTCLILQRKNVKMKKDKYHDLVKEALQKEGWTSPTTPILSDWANEKAT